MAIKILGMSDSTMSITGFATVTKELFRRLNKHPDFEVQTIAQGHLGKDMASVKFTDGDDITHPVLSAGTKPYATEFIKQHIAKHKPDILYCLWDTFMLKQAGYDNIDLAPAKFVMYWPSDGSFLPSTCETILAKSFAPVSMSRHGLRQVKWLFDNKYIGYDIASKAVHIPHAVNETEYYPLADDLKIEARRKYNIPQNAFVVGSVARNQGRKMMDRTIKAFSLFAKDKPEARLFLHSDPKDQAAPSNLVNLIHRWKVQDKVIWSGMKFYKGMSLAEMNEIYNIMDIHFLTTSGEGFGIPTIEAMACGTPSVITAYTTSPELIMENGQVGEMIKLVGCPEIDYTKVDFDNYDEAYAPTHELAPNSICGTWDVERGICDVHDAVRKLNKLYNDRDLLNTYSKLGRAKAVKYYSWDKVVFPMWVRFLKSVYLK